MTKTKIVTMKSDLESDYKLPPTNNRRRCYRMSVHNQDNRKILSQTKRRSYPKKKKKEEEKKKKIKKKKKKKKKKEDCMEKNADRRKRKTH